MSKWINAKWKMPAKDGRYLVCAQYRTPPVWIGVSSLRNGKWDDICVTHWQELPFAPQDLPCLCHEEDHELPEDGCRWCGRLNK